MADTRYCTNCKFFTQKTGSTLVYGKCSAPDALRDGSQLISPDLEFDALPYASTMRNNAPYCGKDGSWFEPKAEG